jgi:hypothetical protein
MHRLTSPAGATVSYEKYGSGPLLVLVHGAFSDRLSVPVEALDELWLARQCDPSMMAERGQSVIGGAGKAVSYKRVTHGAYSTATLQSAPPVQSYTLKAGVWQYRAREIAGLIQQGDREMLIAAADLSFTSQRNDQVVIGGKAFQVVSVSTCSPFGGAAIHIVRIKSGNG